MKTHYPFCAVAASGALVAPIVLWGVLGGSGASAADQPPVAFTVKIPAEVDSASIAVTASPDTDAERALQDGQSLDLLPITTGISLSADRTLTVRVDPTALPATYVEANGVSTFEVVALGAGGATTWSKVVSPQAVTTPTGPAWTAPGEVATDASEPMARARPREEDLPEVDDPGAPMQGGALVKVSGRSATLPVGSRGTAMQAAIPGGNCQGPRPRQTQVAKKVVWSTIGTTYPTEGSAATMQVDSSQGATYGIGVSGSGAFGSWTGNGSRTVTGGWNFTWSGSSSSRSYRKEVEYRKYKFEYLDSRCNTYKWMPNVETGGVTEVRGIGRPDFWECHKVSAGDWYRYRSDGAAYELGTGVKFSAAIGIDLSVKRQYSKAQQLKYHIVGSNKYLCGIGNAYPSVAGKLMERVIG